MKNDSPNFKLPALDYAFAALEPFIDASTMEIHHDKHHKAYVDNLNNALTKMDYKNETLEEILHHIGKYSIAVRNNAGGHYNHSLFWKLLGFSKKQLLHQNLKLLSKKSLLPWKISKSYLLKLPPVDLEVDGSGLLIHLMINCKSFQHLIKIIP